MANSRVKYKGCKDVYGYQSNMHNLIYKDAKFENVQLQNVIFISTRLTDAKNLELGQGCICLKSYPKNEISCRLKDSIIRLAEYEKLYNYHVLHVNKNKLNMWNISLLLQYGDENLARAMETLYRRKNKYAFYTIYAYKKFVESYLKI